MTSPQLHPGSTKRQPLSKLLKKALFFWKWGFNVLSDVESLTLGGYNRHLFRVMQRVVRGKLRRLVVNLPPRHGKTLICTVIPAAWLLLNNPKLKIIVACFGNKLAAKILRDIVRLIEDPACQRAFPCELISATEGEIITTVGGGIVAASIEGSLQGRGADFIFIDDPNRAEDARSPNRLEFINRQYDSVISERLNSKRSGSIVVVQHRVAENDLTGHLLASGEFTQVAMPWLAEEDRRYTLADTDLSWLQKAGEFLRSDEFSEQNIERYRRKQDFDYIFQQGIAAAERKIVREDFSWFSDPLPRGPIIFSVDPAYTVGEGRSHSAVGVWQRGGDRHYLLFMLRERLTPDLLKAAIGKLHSRYNPAAILVEKDGALDFVASLRKLAVLRGTEVIAIGTRNRNKWMRFAPHIPLIKSGGIVLPVGADWADIFIDSMTSASPGFTDDVVDATSLYLEWAGMDETPRKPPECPVGVIGNVRGWTHSMTRDGGGRLNTRRTLIPRGPTFPKGW